MVLRRILREQDLVAITINAVIGAGIFGIPGRIFSLIGPWSLLACVACGAFAGLVVLCFAEVGSRFRETGGPYLYAREAFGPGVAFGVGCLMWLARVSAFAANANLLLIYLSTFGFGLQVGYARVAALGIMASVLTTINLVGIRNAAIVNHLFTFGKLLPLIAFVSIGAIAVVPSRLVLGPAPSVSNFSAAVLLLVYAFTGFEMAAVPSGEMRQPEKSLPRSLLVALSMIAAIYVFVQAVCIGTLPQLANSTKPLADASLIFLGPVGSRLIVAGIVVSIAGNLHITVLSASRIPFAMAEQRQLPRIFRRTSNRFGSPDFAVVFTGVVMLGFTLAATFIGALSISTVSRLIVYISTCAALPVLRKKSLPASFRIPGGIWISAAAVGISLWLLAHAPRQEWSAVLFVLFASGAVFYLNNRTQRAHVDRS